jgi:hypothetical protein
MEIKPDLKEAIPTRLQIAASGSERGASAPEGEPSGSERLQVAELICHSRGNGNPDVAPAKAGNYIKKLIPVRNGDTLCFKEVFHKKILIPVELAEK